VPISAETAQQAYAAICGQFADYIEASGSRPTLERDWLFLDHPSPWAVVWEEGPDQWAMRAGEGGVDEALTEMASDLLAPGEKLRTPPAEKWPDGCYPEPITSFAVSLVETC